jgi:hypothetical protein
MNANRYEVARNEFDEARVGIHLGIQPSTARSHRRRAEVEQDELVSGSALRGLQVVSPGNLSWHGVLRWGRLQPACQILMTCSVTAAAENRIAPAGMSLS